MSVWILQSNFEKNKETFNVFLKSCREISEKGLDTLSESFKEITSLENVCFVFR